MPKALVYILEICYHIYIQTKFIKNDGVLIMNNKPIGVFDSGVGGISVLKELYMLMPNENYIYYGDSKNAPYGTKSDEEIEKLTRCAIKKLTDMNVKAVVIACNTATSVAAGKLRDILSIPVVGIEPAVKPAASNHPGKKIIVMATPVTLRKEKFLHLMDSYKSDADIIPLPCPGLVELIERGNEAFAETAQYLKDLFKPFEGERIGAIVLGCTHYPHIADIIKNSFSYEVDIIDGGRGTAKETKRQLDALGALNENQTKGNIRFISSAESSSETEFMKKMFYN